MKKWKLALVGIACLVSLTVLLGCDNGSTSSSKVTTSSLRGTWAKEGTSSTKLIFAETTYSYEYSGAVQYTRDYSLNGDIISFNWSPSITATATVKLSGDKKTLTISDFSYPNSNTSGFNGTWIKE
ncbi:hypothetical protein [Breznakiella homolactica]|uniref:Lipocalin-like domain-containing protein n=1 Tax=Breznakiella homolactica TaxID=2798577 RepID=A0A7T7XPK3_9SPIR|nr:hypothetical protein [Breznakiella homolactica]QQO10033.1 hypothetical protein JFL75_03715 [Breznakiella homolactica]